MTSDVHRRLKIAHFGAFDHDSYGDLIFPFLVEHFLPDFEFVHVSPSGNPTKWQDAKKTISVAEAILIDDWDGVLVGGGDIVQSNEWISQIWAQSPLLYFGALSSLWCGASLLAAKLEVPCAWNAPGVPHKLPENIISIAKDALQAVDYLAVRDSFSVEKLNTLLDVQVHVAPDTALGVSELWPVSSSKKFLKTKPLVISLTPTDIQQRWHEIELLFDCIATRDDFSGEVIFLPLMAWQGDAELLLQKMKVRSDISLTIKDRSLTLKECALEIAGSLGYVGNSLHGLITAASYGVPGVLVNPLGYKANTKYIGFMSHFDMTLQMEANSFAEAAKFFNSIPLSSFNIALEKLSSHWFAVSNVLKQKHIPNKNKIWNDVCNRSFKDETTMLMFGLSSEQLLKRGVGLKLENAELNLHLAQLNEALIERDNRIAMMDQAISASDAQLSSMKEFFGSLPWFVKKLMRKMKNSKKKNKL